MTEFAIDIQNLKHHYNKKQGGRLEFSIPKWSVERGDTVFLQGKSGSGKSTVLNLLSGILKPSDGALNMLGEDIAKMSASQVDAFRARHIGVVFQTFNLIPYLPVIQNIALAPYFAKQPLDIDKAKTLLAALNLPEHLLEQPVNQLSIGQQQRVAIVRAMINAPEILLVDEPTSALDSDARDAFMSVLLEAVEKTNTTLVFVSHDKSLAKFFKTTQDVTALFDNQEAQ